MNWWSYTRKPSVHERRQKAAREARRFAKSGKALSPVAIDGLTIARSFWGKAWCANLASYRDFENRLPRGRSYVRRGSVLDLQVASGKITALVSGSNLYQVAITVKPVVAGHWGRIKTQCAGNVGSIIELLEGRLSERVMQVITHRDDGLFPKPAEIQMECSCPDWATMCKHVAAVMYGVGARLDQQPELLFTLRNVDHAELIAQAADLAVNRRGASRKTLADDALGDVFGIELAVPRPATMPEPAQRGGARRKKVARAAQQKKGRRVVAKSKR
ncbi:MAG: hypothetical protein ABI885_03380 [Gammaproteobacteria bacterium]